jgi:pimeloyl-ACP methyl ester carboxylesterase
MIVQRVSLWFPENVLAVGCICVPFAKPNADYISVEQLVKKLPNFMYQLYFASPESERDLSSPEAIEKFLKGVFRIKGDTPTIWNASNGVLAKMGDPTLSKMWETENVWKFYLRSFQMSGLRGPLTYYKTRELNYKDEVALLGKVKIQCPAMFIGAKRDEALPPGTWENQLWVPHLEMYTVNGGHWCLVENGGHEIGEVIQAWVAKISKLNSKL